MCKTLPSNYNFSTTTNCISVKTNFLNCDKVPFWICYYSPQIFDLHFGSGQNGQVQTQSTYFHIVYVWKQNLNFGRTLKKGTIMKHSTLYLYTRYISKYSFGHLTLLYPMACITQIYILKSLLNVSPNREPFHDQNTLALMRRLSTHYIYLIFLLLEVIY